MRTLLVLLSFVSVAHAQTEEEQRAYIQRIAQACSSYGFIPDTPAFSNCVMQMDIANRQAMQQQRSVILQQYLQDNAAAQQRALPLCSQVGPGMRGYLQAQGQCR